MDTSETYIKMCDTPEIQELCEWEFADRVATKVQLVPNRSYVPYVVGKNIYRVFLNIGSDMEREVAKDLCIWLPRQDQLQEILAKHEYISGTWLQDLITRFNNYLREKNERGLEMNGLLGSMEQLWLAFVMKEKFNKVWDGDKWLPTSQEHKME